MQRPGAHALSDTRPSHEQVGGHMIPATLGCLVLRAGGVSEHTDTRGDRETKAAKRPGLQAFRTRAVNAVRGAGALTSAPTATRRLTSARSPRAAASRRWPPSFAAAVDLSRPAGVAHSLRLTPLVAATDSARLPTGWWLHLLATVSPVLSTGVTSTVAADGCNWRTADAAVEAAGAVVARAVGAAAVGAAVVVAHGARCAGPTVVRRRRRASSRSISRWDAPTCRDLVPVASILATSDCPAWAVSRSGRLNCEKSEVLRVLPYTPDAGLLVAG